MDMLQLYNQAQAAQKSGNLVEAERLYRQILSQAAPPEVLVDLGNLLARAEAVIHGAAAESVPSEIFVNTAPEAWLQMETGMPRRLVDREIGRSREPRCHTAQPETASAVSPERAVSAVAGQP